MVAAILSSVRAAVAVILVVKTVVCRRRCSLAGLGAAAVNYHCCWLL